MLQFPDLASLDDDAVDRAYEQIVQLVREQEPDMDDRRGLLSDIVCGLHSMLQAASQQNVENVRHSVSVMEAIKAPDMAADGLIDAIASNYGLDRRPAIRAIGPVAVVTTSDRQPNLRMNDIFKDPQGRKFYIFNPPTQTPTPLNDSQWVTVMDVMAVEPGVADMLTRRTALTPDRTPAGFVEAYAASDFTRGQDQQSNSELLARMRIGMSARVFSTRANIEALLRGYHHPENYPMVTDEFAKIEAVSIVGMGDKEMTRDQRGLLGVSMGGRVDLYLRSCQLPKCIGLMKEAKLHDSCADHTDWEIEIGRDEAPGFYKVRSVYPAGEPLLSADCCVIDDQRSLDIVGEYGYVPDMQGLSEGGFSRFQTTTLIVRQFNPGIGVVPKTQQMEVELLSMPLVREVQQFLAHPNIRPPAADVLVRAAIPCWLKVDVGLDCPDGYVIQDAELAKQLAEFINKSGFATGVYASALSASIAHLLPDCVAIRSIDIGGTLYKPDGSIRWVEPSQHFQLPSEFQKSTALFLETTAVTCHG